MPTNQVVRTFPIPSNWTQFIYAQGGTGGDPSGGTGGDIGDTGNTSGDSSGGIGGDIGDIGGDTGDVGGDSTGDIPEIDRSDKSHKQPPQTSVDPSDDGARGNGGCGGGKLHPGMTTAFGWDPKNPEWASLVAKLGRLIQRNDKSCS